MTPQKLALIIPPRQALLSIATILFLLTSPTTLQAAPDTSKPVPSPEMVQARVWRNMKLQDFTLKGALKVLKKKRYPLTLRTKGRIMLYELQKPALQIRVEFTPDGSIIERRSSSDAPWKKLTPKERLAPILDTDILYEDLGFDFVHWPEIFPIGADTIKTFPTWCYEATPPDLSNYSKARFWISSEFLGVMRVDAYNENNQPIKRVEVNSTMKVGEVHVIKEMAISTLMPDRNLSKSRSFILVTEAHPGSNL